ncbi:lipoprotein-anchoring transpeptidase ErfK/SrfK [Natronocella acetinitrilica]|uniref:Lipoprotein-anchoring transpeptidase ErfK/SrfK n=1 Tax=Natronocella acetinitrilica TaxID=414046 RepID=A0AAE3G557_9GAMM|nr:L,D-transpeptidase [Natronocella acetinitrilica]MCP1676075.1 lipoprotein-anchoring transpeptidase ErfK/SrfK [Natronocella acetinitrilica]
MKDDGSGAGLAHPARQGRWLDVDIQRQRLTLREGDRALAEFPVATAARGIGQQEGSFQTPTGWHYVRARIGEGVPLGAVFRGRRWTGEICDAALYASNPARDWILTRILWLCGLEPGHNRGGRVDSMRRYIYLHGCPDEVGIGEPASKGCIRLRNQDMLMLFDQVPAGSRVLIRQ